jgi:Sulfocyanin (SoxE) domain
MFSRNRVTRVPLVGAVILVFTGCSGGDHRTADTRDSTAPMTTGAAPSDTATPATTPEADTGTVRTQSAAVSQTPAPKPRVRPSIDPGRKSTPSSSKPKTASRDSAASTVSAASTDSAAAGTSTSSSSAAAPTSSGPGQDQGLKYDAKTNTVTFQLIGGPSGFQFNGFSSGGATLTLPPNAKVVMNFINKDGTPHSAEVIPGEGPIPNGAGDPAIPRAYTNKALEGLPQEATDVMNFTVPASGNYRIFCGVPGHGLSGMWIWMKIDPNAKTPSFGPTKA